MTQLSKMIFASALGITLALGINLKVQAQVTNVNQLRDVSPTDWADEAIAASSFSGEDINDGEIDDLIIGEPNFNGELENGSISEGNGNDIIFENDNVVASSEQTEGSILFPSVDTPSTASVPEPSTTLALLALTGSGLFLTSRGKRKGSQKKSVA